MPLTIAVVGNINLDIKTARLAPTASLFTDGETSVGEIYETFGGGAANVALAARSLGCDVHFCAASGADSLGERLAGELKRSGVSAHLARKDAATGRSICLNWDNNHRHFVSYLPSAGELARTDIDIEALAAAGRRHLYRGDIWFSEPMLDGGNADLLQAARALGMETTIDINWDPVWSRPGGDDLRAHRIAQAVRMLPHVSYVQVNERELGLFTGIADLGDGAQALLDLGAGAVIVHRGPAGSAALTAGGEWAERPAVAVPHPVCETGTGDVFSAAFLHFHDLPIPERLTASNTIAARHLGGEIVLIPRL